MAIEKPSEQENLESKGKKHIENISEWDNDTYGHISSYTGFRRKDEPADEHQENSNASTKLKNINLTKGDDVSQRNSKEEKGLKGKAL
ncbi:hypothetical protein [Pedobacter jamesrossensis]|uniref:Uncharacterized protein n=1 Tax=Pedobacter jamesrossensis TaxID=1908238 RepID=A0ABV8NN05_9SPHI